MTKNDLLPIGSIIQICPVCDKVDVYKDDGHNCSTHIFSQEAQEYYD